MMLIYVIFWVVVFIFIGVNQDSMRGNTRAYMMFAWHDIWVGIYYDKKKQTLYILRFPMIGIVILFNFYKNTGK